MVAIKASRPPVPEPRVPCVVSFRCGPPSTVAPRLQDPARADPEAMTRSDGGAESVCRSLKTLAHFGQFSRGEVDPFLLYLRSVVLLLSSPLLTVSALAKVSELLLHLRDRSRQIGQLSSDSRYVLVGRHAWPRF